MKQMPSVRLDLSSKEGSSSSLSQVTWMACGVRFGWPHWITPGLLYISASVLWQTGWNAEFLTWDLRDHQLVRNLERWSFFVHWENDKYVIFSKHLHSHHLFWLDGSLADAESINFSITVTQPPNPPARDWSQLLAPHSSVFPQDTTSQGIVSRQTCLCLSKGIDHNS